MTNPKQGGAVARRPDGSRLTLHQNKWRKLCSRLPSRRTRQKESRNLSIKRDWKVFRISPLYFQFFCCEIGRVRCFSIRHIVLFYRLSASFLKSYEIAHCALYPKQEHEAFARSQKELIDLGPRVRLPSPKAKASMHGLLRLLSEQFSEALCIF